LRKQYLASSTYALWPTSGTQLALALCVQYIPPEVCGQTGRAWYHSGHEEEGPGEPRGQSDAILQESLQQVSLEDVQHSEQPRSHK